MRDGTADRAPVPGHDMTDEWQGLRQERTAGAYELRPLGGSLPDEGADSKRTVFFRDAVEACREVQVNQDARAHESHVERGEEALAAGEDFRFVTVRAQRLHRVLGRLCANVGERHRLHVSSSQTRAGVNGSSTPSTPSASATAFAIATGALIVVPSPSPFAPSAVNGEGVSRCAILTEGMSAAVGHR